MQDPQNPADFEADRVLKISRKIGSCRVVRIVNQRKASDVVRRVYDQAGFTNLWLKKKAFE
jgi:hypothetical protein